jgi:putative membrane protein
MLLSMAIFWGALAWLVVVLVRGREPRAGDRPDDRPDAETILAERLARGEIDPAEYAERLEALRRAGRAGGAGALGRPAP